MEGKGLLMSKQGWLMEVMMGVTEFHNHQDNPMPRRYWECIDTAITKALESKLEESHFWSGDAKQTRNFMEDL